ncbi:MAG: phosphoglucomutase, alpha-D-glucose phosphate-specific [Gammaproteobacteria bacterium]
MTDDSIPLDVAALVAAYFATRPDPAEPAQRVVFGTSGHRGSALRGSFNEAHILAVTEGVVRYRRAHGIDGPLFLGMDTHALSAPAFETALAVLAAHDVDVMVDAANGFTPTPVISRAIVRYNRGRADGFADGIVITPSHNPPEDGGIKYNPPHGGPAGSVVTGWIEAEANRLLVDAGGIPRAARGARVQAHDYVGAYVADLAEAVDLAAIARAGVHIGVDPLGGAGVAYFAPLAERYGLNLEVVNDSVDVTFAFMPPDHDGRIRMDCSSTAAMRKLIALGGRYDIAFGNDPDADRHGIVTAAGLMNPNHYLAVAVDYLVGHRPAWPAAAAVGKTVVTSALVDRVAAAHGRAVFEVPVGFKWFVEGLADTTLGFAGEESAGASFLDRGGRTWTTDKDGILLGLLAAEILAVTGADPAAHYQRLARLHGAPCYTRRDSAASAAVRKAVGALGAADVTPDLLVGAPVDAVLTAAPGDGNPIGGVKVLTTDGWFALRPSGTEDVCKVYAESLRDEAHLATLVAAGEALLARVGGRA